MKKTAIAIAVAMSGFAVIAQAASKDNIWYTGGRLGLSQFHNTGFYNNNLSNDKIIYNNQLGLGVFGGYQINQNVGLEVGYDKLGRMSYKNKAVHGAFTAQCIQMTAKFNYPVEKYLDVYTRLGGAVWHVNSSNSATGNSHDNDVSPVLTGGMEWVLAHNIATRLEYQWINNIGNNHTVNFRPDNSMINLGISYRFGQQNITTEPVISTSSLTTTEDKNKQFAVKSDVLFDFDKYVLNSEGRYVLDQILTRLSNLSIKDTSIVILGFTDRIGPNIYNRNLAEKRTQSVVNYLISKGIPKINISAHGIGNSDPVTGNNCNDITDRTKLIDCLAPDRRVHVEIIRIKDVITLSHPSV